MALLGKRRSRWAVGSLQVERAKAQPCFFFTHVEGRAVFADFLFDSLGRIVGNVQTAEQYGALTSDVVAAVDGFHNQEDPEATYLNYAIAFSHAMCVIGAREGWSGTNNPSKRAMCDLLACASICTSTRRAVIDDVERMAKAKAIVTLCSPPAMDLRNMMCTFVSMPTEGFYQKLFNVFQRCCAFYASLPPRARRESWEQTPPLFVPLAFGEMAWGRLRP